MAKLLVFFSHKLTKDQIDELEWKWDIHKIIYLPPDIQRLWSHIPPDQALSAQIMAPFEDFILRHTSPGDCCLIEGDFGATYQLVRFSKKQGLNALYATTKREAIEEVQPDNSIIKTSLFFNVKFPNLCGRHWNNASCPF
ncbi:MAG: hypothetical protein CSA81_13275 [Acidobacteria bacterium]|nr:MAG: hypothetical protein CSA81_13275 [Acidobacteriota bacterium]